MSFKDNIEPYINHIEIALNGRCTLSSRVLKPIEQIYYDFIDSSKPINMGCNSCIKTMLKKTLIEFNKVKDKPVKMTFPKQVDYNAMKWGEFRKYCKELGITNISKKNRDELTKELLER